LQVNAYLPGVLWLVLILGASVTIMSACLFGTSDFRLHLVQVVMLTLMISSALVAIGDINLPFQGSVCVQPLGFVRAEATLGDIP
jgi:ABC-type branched-subunit amino acid transport system permease subunit